MFFPLCWFLWLPALLFPFPLPAQSDAPFCQILDRLEDPVWHATVGYVAQEDVEDANDFGLIELETGAGLAYLHTAAGTFDLRLRFDVDVTTGSGGVDLPDQYGSLALELDWALRGASGRSLLLEASPGFYTDFEDLSGKDLFVPLRASMVQAFNDRISGQAGLAVFPGFDRVVDPIAGIRWGLSDSWLLDLFYPDSRLVFSPVPALRLHAGYSIREYPEYQLADDDDRDRFLYREQRWYLGAQYAIGDTAHLLVDAGRVVHREIDFENGAGGDVDPALFVRIGLGGLL